MQHLLLFGQEQNSWGSFKLYFSLFPLAWGYVLLILPVLFLIVPIGQKCVFISGFVLIILLALAAEQFFLCSSQSPLGCVGEGTKAERLLWGNTNNDHFGLLHSETLLKSSAHQLNRLANGMFSFNHGRETRMLSAEVVWLYFCTDLHTVVFCSCTEQII